MDRDITQEETSASKRYTYFRRLPTELHPYVYNFEDYPMNVKTKLIERIKKFVKNIPLKY